MNINKNILVTGSNGQLGSEIKAISSILPDAAFLFTDVAELDITDSVAIDKFISENNITHIINCAAYTAVDKAEQDVELCNKINRDACENLAKSVHKHNAFLVHISTDYVFDGNGTKPYVEDDTTNPQTVYGSSKLAGETAIRNNTDKAIIIRTAWLYSIFGNNFVKTMRRLGAEKSDINVVADQRGTPTNAADLAEAILKIIPQLDNWNKGVELYHFSNEGECAWFDFAKEIMQLSNLNCNVHPISTEQYPTPIPRPRYSVLDKSKIKNDFSLIIPDWKSSLIKMISRLA